MKTDKIYRQNDIKALTHYAGKRQKNYIFTRQMQNVKQI